MEGSGDEFGGNEKTARPPRGRSVGKGKVAAHKMPSPRAPSAILRLGKDIPVTYEPLGVPLVENELVELDWFALAGPTARQAKPSKKGKKKSMAPVSGVSPTASQTLPTRRWRSFTAPQMTLTPELEALGEVELSDGVFRFPFSAAVIKYFSSLDAFLIGRIIGRTRCELSTSRRGASKHVYPFMIFMF
jgi:hypothetical protein